jgi:hypothetical protein
MMKDLYKLKTSLWHFNNIDVYWKRITDNTSSILNVTSNNCVSILYKIFINCVSQSCIKYLLIVCLNLTWNNNNLNEQSYMK